MADNRLNPSVKKKGRQARKRSARAQTAQGPAEPVEGVAVPGAREQRPEEEPQAVAKEPTFNTSSAGTPPPGETEAPVTEHPVATRPGETQTPVTEKPVAIRRKISQYIVSVDGATGAIIKIEKLDDKTGQPKEFTQEEYAAAYSFASYAAPYYAAYTTSLYDPLSNPTVQAYLKGMSDYLKAFTAER